MGLTVTNLVARCLAYLNKTTADTMPTGATMWLVDAVQGALGEMRDAAPGLFRRKVGGVILAEATQNVAVTSGSAGITLTTTVGDLNTIRIPTGLSDYTLQGVNGTAASVVPVFEGTTNAAAAATIWNDAWNVSDGAAYSESDIAAVRINGQELEEVASREAAECRHGVAQHAGSGLASARSRCIGGELPHYWWRERYGKKTYVMLYPMPVTRANIEAELTINWTDLSTSDVLASTATYDLPDDVAREIWRPLVIARWAAAPLWSNAEAKVEIDRQAELARERLAKMKPKKRCDPCFGSELPRSPLSP